MIRWIYLGAETVLAAAAWMFFGKWLLSRSGRAALHTGRMRRWRRRLRSRFDTAELDAAFAESGLKLTAIRYQTIRYTVLAVWIALTAVPLLAAGGPFPWRNAVTVLALFALTSPKRAVRNKPTPFRFVLDQFQERHRQRKNAELFQCVTQLKNLALARRSNPPGARYMLERLQRTTGVLRPQFNRMLSLWDLGRREEACRYFQQAVNTQEAEELAQLFLKLDHLPPAELKRQLMLLQETIKGERLTARVKANLNRSQLLYGIVVAAVFLVFLNFLVVVFYIDFLNQIRLV